MSSFDLIGMCVRNLLKRKLRTMLTMLGVIIGTAALVLTISLGLASDARFEQMALDMNIDMTSIEVRPSPFVTWTPEGPVTPEGVPELDSDAVALLQDLPGVILASPTSSTQLFIRSGPYQMWGNVTGMSAAAIEMLFPLSAGRYLEPGEQNTAIFGAFAENSFWRPTLEDPWGWNTRASQRMWGEGEEIETYVDIFSDAIMCSTDNRFLWMGMEEEDFDEVAVPMPVSQLNVVGVLEETGRSWGPGSDFDILMDIETLRYLEIARLEAERERDEEGGMFSARHRVSPITYNEVLVRVDDPSNTAAVAEMIEEIGFSSWYQGMWIDTMQEMQQTVQNLLIGIAAVSIFVAAISIANTMVMAVYERTREIGVMKVIGGAIKDIRSLFLLEAAFIGFLGGLFGVGLSLIVSYILNNAGLGIIGDQMGGWMMEEMSDVTTSLITPWLCGLALAFASLIGLISGYFPARRATKISALDAIRTD